MRRALLRRAPAAAAAACAILAAGCGGDGLPPALTPGQRADLHTLVSQARTAAGGGDLAATTGALARLKARVRTLRDSGALGTADAAELVKFATLAELKAAHTIRAQAASATPPPAAAATPAPAATTADPTPAVTPPPAAAVAPGQAKKAKGHGRAKGAKKGG